MGGTKLKMDKSVMFSLLFIGMAVIYMVALIIEGNLYGTHYSSWIWGGVIILFGIIAFRYINVPSNIFRLLLLALYLILGTALWHYELGVHMDTVLSKNTFYVQVGVMFGLMLLILPIAIYYKSKLKNHYRKIFELGARPVENQNDGFTTRPYPAGKAEYTRNEILGFADFLKKNQIVLPEIQENGIVMQLATEFVNTKKKDKKDQSYVAFQNTGEVTVNISRNDYEKFKEKLSFDDLCNSIASLFIGLLNQYKDGQQEEILKLLESMDSKRVKVLTSLASIGLLILVILLTWFYFKAL